MHINFSHAKTWEEYSAWKTHDFLSDTVGNYIKLNVEDSTSAEKGSANSWKVLRCTLKLAKCWSNSCNRDIYHHHCMLCPAPHKSYMLWNEWVVFVLFFAESWVFHSLFCGEGVHIVTHCDELTRALDLQVKDVSSCVISTKNARSMTHLR